MEWGRQTMMQIENDFAISGSDLFAHSKTELFPDYAWGQGVMLHALCAAAKLDSQYIDDAEALAREFHNRYWCYANGIWGYNAACDMCGDRYYDDNAWLALALLELYEINGNSTYLERARDVVKYSMSGENPSPESGIRWHEGDTGGTSVCSTAPTILANLIIYQATWIQQYYDDALRLWNWMTNPQYGIQDAQVGLFHQGLHENLSLNGGYLGYQTAVPLQAALRFYQITGQTSWLTEARHLASSMETHFVNSQTHALAQTGQWGGHDMTNAYVELYYADYNQHWLDVAAACLAFLHDNCLDSEGRYPEYWNDTTSGGTNGLMNQATVARAYWKMASTPGGTAPLYPVMLFKDCNYGGWSAGFSAGNYTLYDLNFHGVYNEDISSVMITSDYTVTFYIDDNFQGTSLTKTSDDSCFVDDGWNDQITSMRIQESGLTPPPYELGDVDNNGSITIVDALLIAQYYVGLNPENFNQSRADTNCDGSINILDALLVAQYYVGIIPGFC